MKAVPLEKDPHFLRQTILSLTDQIDLFGTFQSLSLKIISQFDLENIFTTFAAIIREVMPYRSAAIYLFDESGRSFHTAWTSDAHFPDRDNTFPDKKIIFWVMSQGRWTIITDLQDTTSQAIVSILPVKSPKHALGFMIIETDFTPDISNQKLSPILDFLASQTAIAIENQGLYSKIRSANAYMKDMLESISNGILAVDLKGRLTRFNKNATAILGIKGKKIIGSHYQTVLEPELAKKIDKIFNAALSRRMLPESMVQHRPYREVSILIGITASLLTDRQKKIIGVIFSFRDMSASKEIERLTRLDEMKSEFVSNVSHELRTPLSIIKSYTEALINQVEPKDHETRENFLSVIDTETDRLSSMVSNLLDLSRIESGKFVLNYKHFRLEDLVNSVISVFKSKLDNIRIFTEFNGRLPEIRADQERIKDVLINLIANGIKFSPMGGTIHISVEQKDAFLSCSVSDTGMGIPADKQKKIFEKFFRVDSSDTYEIEGTGLGLSIVKHILDCHGGNITVSSILGKGSVFTFNLPLTGDAREI